MQFDWNWIIGPIVGAIIGLITNGIAIRMLFRPLHAVKIGDFTLPFTPGLIPKEKPRIAHSIGVLVADKLVNAEVLEKGMLNPETDKKIEDFITSFLDKYKDNHQSVQELLIQQFGEENFKYYSILTENKLAEIVYQKAITMDLGRLAINAMENEFARKDQESPSSVQFLPMVISLAEGKIVETINETVEQQGFIIISQFIEKQADELLSIPISEIYSKSEKYIPVIKEKVISAYHFTVQNYLPKILQELNLAKLVEDQINGFSLEELEKLLLELMKKELNAIVYLGGLLGAIMGVIMIFV